MVAIGVVDGSPPRIPNRPAGNECESFFVGRYPSVLQAQGLPVPEWAWLSMLAHAPVDLLAAQAAGMRRRQYREHLTVLCSERWLYWSKNWSCDGRSHWLQHEGAPARCHP